ncbi:lipopolysaccharide biosynthesis protein [Methanococcoides seepicolus]|uniref:Oligosaccharide flippase family protein n=1 Tax=Methanococcoides seepicolus TaxID=2828780 RepID=A0A9E4ZJ86_9EURY|nr:oligosaccharide flippase family protein [Methanococcoides seepicolus]MCM1987574.1 oligosaccharide flippase family protein [Methanococcoides seepicolus]
MFDTTSQKALSKQLPKNLISNGIYFAINLIIGILLVPFFIDNLGVAGYAIIPLATSVTSYVGLVTQSLNMSVSRYLTVDLQSQDFKKANVTFNTALFGTLGIIILTIPIALILSYYAPTFFDIPLNQKHDAFLLFLGVIGAFLIRAWSSNFGVSLFAYNRLDLQNIVNIVNIIVQVSAIVILFLMFSPKLSYIGFSYLLGSLAAFVVTIILSRKINPHLKLNYSDFKPSRLKKLAQMGGWVTVNQIGALLFLQIDLIVVNKLFGATAGGEYSMVLIWSTLLRSIAAMLASVVTPIILAYYAKKRYEDIITFSKKAVKFMGFAMALPIGIIIGFAPQILTLWIGPEFAKLSPLMLVLLIHLVINLSVLPLFSINVSFNKVRIPGIVTLFMGFGNFLLAIILSLFTDWGYYGVAIAGAIMLTTKNTLFIPWYASKVLEISKNTFTSSIASGFLSVIAIVSTIKIINYYFEISSLISLIIYCTIISVAYILVVWSVGLNQSDRRIIESFLPPSIRSR